MSNPFVRPTIAEFQAYKVDPPQYDIILNANENPWDFPSELKEELCSAIMDADLNRYPDASFTELRGLMSDYTGIDADQIIVGCGSDEIIAMIGETFINPGDVVISHTPSFSMYDIWSTIAGGRFIGIPDQDEHLPNLEQLITVANENNAKLIYLCNPNNPTGYLFPRHDIIRILQETNALVILDEAYIEFKEGESQVDLVDKFPNLLVMRTLSKAFGLAGIRCGYCMGNRELIDSMYKVKSPYNLNTLTQMAAIIALKNRKKLLNRLSTLAVERRKMYRELLALPINKVYPTASNFIYFETSKGTEIYETMKENNILIKHFAKSRNQVDAIRLTIGSPDENQKVLEILKGVFAND